MVLAATVVLAACGRTVDAEEAQPAPAEARTEGAALMPTGEQPTTADLAGVWRLADGDRLMWLGGDGRFAIDDRGLLGDSPAVIGTYELDGRTIRLSNGDGDLCPPGNWALDVSIAGDGALETLVAEDVEGRCSVGVGTRWTWVRVSPVSRAGAALAAEGLAGDGAPPGAETVAGIWLLEGTGLLLRFAGDGTYALDDEGDLPGTPADTGTFEVDDQATITFTSGAETRRCSEGDRWIWEGTRLVIAPSQTDAAGLAQPGDWALHATAVVADDCAHAVPAGGQWLRLSP